MKRANVYIDELFCGVLTEDPEGYLLTGFDRTSFLEAMKISDIEQNIGNKLINRLIKNQTKWMELIDHSFISTELMDSYKDLLLKE